MHVQCRRGPLAAWVQARNKQPLTLFPRFAPPKRMHQLITHLCSCQLPLLPLRIPILLMLRPVARLHADVGAPGAYHGRQHCPLVVCQVPASGQQPRLRGRLGKVLW